MPWIVILYITIFASLTGRSHTTIIVDIIPEVSLCKFCGCTGANRRAIYKNFM